MADNGRYDTPGTYTDDTPETAVHLVHTLIQLNRLLSSPLNSNSTRKGHRKVRRFATALLTNKKKHSLIRRTFLKARP